MSNIIPSDLPEPDLSFLHALWKLQWAEHHVKNLDAVHALLMREHPRSIGAEFQPHINGWAAVVRAKALNQSVSLLTGDIVHNLRACLDYCWMGLNRSVNPNCAKKTLPRAETRDKLKTSINNTLVQRSIQGADSLLLDQLKPYEGGNNIIWHAGKLDNWNKHNLLNITFGKATVTNVKARAASGIIDGIVIGSAEAKTGQPLPTLSFSEIGPNDRMELECDPYIALEIILRCWETEKEWLLMPFATALFEDTKEAIQGFIGAFARRMAFDGQDVKFS